MCFLILHSNPSIIPFILLFKTLETGSLANNVDPDEKPQIFKHLSISIRDLYDLHFAKLGLILSFSTLKMFLPSLRVFVLLCVSLSTLNVFLPSLRVFVCLCASLSVFACLCPSLPVFVCLCVVWVSLRYLDRPLLAALYWGEDPTYFFVPLAFG